LKVQLNPKGGFRRRLSEDEKEAAVMEKLVIEGLLFGSILRKPTESEGHKKKVRFLKSAETGEWITPKAARKLLEKQLTEELGRKPTKKELNYNWSELGKESIKEGDHKGEVVKLPGRKALIFQ
jgi:hypothetical protein